MANQITDNRTLVDAMEAASVPVNLTGATSNVNNNTDVKVAGSSSFGTVVSSQRRGILADAGSAQDWSNETFYVWINCGIVGLLDTKANGGMRIRFCGATVTDFFEVDVGGNDDWPNAIEGGWVQFVVDIEEAHTNSDATGGTKPGTNAIQYVGYSAITTAASMMVDNTWMDEIRRIPNDGLTPAVIIEGQDQTVSAHDWNWSDVLAQLGVGVGVIKAGPAGSYILNGPIQWGINDTTTHGFTDTNQVLLWESQEHITDGFYNFKALGNSGGTTRVVAGVKTGTGDDATGAQGWTVVAASNDFRWDMDFDDPDLDQIDFHGCTFVHGGDFHLDDVAVSVISSLYVDCDLVVATNSQQLRNQIIQPNTADGVAFMQTDDLGDFVFCSFEFTDGHGVEILSGGPATQTSKGNRFSGFGATGTNDAAVYNNAGAARTINVTEGATVAEHTYRNGASASTTVQASVDYDLVGMNDGTELTVLDRDVEMLNITGSATTLAFGDAAATERMGQSFQVASTAKAERIRIRLRKVGTPTDGVTIRLVNGVPGSTLFAESLILDAADITTSFVEYDIDLTEKNSLTASTTYGIEIQRTGSVDGSNYYEIEYDTGNPHTSGVRYVYNASWGSSTGDLLLTIMEAASDNELFHVESSSGTESYTHNGTAKEVEVLAMHTNYLPIAIIDSLQTVDSSVTLTQAPDRTFSNP